MTGRQMTQCCVDYAVTFRFSEAEGSFDLRISEPFVLRRASGEHLLRPEDDPTGMGPALSLLHQTVTEAVAFKAGRLELTFSDGSVVKVPVRQDYEPWELVGPGGVRVVSLPGGDLAVWRAENDVRSG